MPLHSSTHQPVVGLSVRADLPKATVESLFAGISFATDRTVVHDGDTYRTYSSQDDALLSKVHRLFGGDINIDELCCTPKKEYRRRRQRVRCLLTAYAVEGFLCGQTAKEDLPPLAAAKLAGRRGVRGTPAAWRTSDALYSTSSTISSSASIFSSSISFSFSSRALKSITKSL